MVYPKESELGQQNKELLKTNSHKSETLISPSKTSSKMEITPTKQTELGKDKMMTPQQRKTTLLKEYNKHTADLIETEHLAHTIRLGMETNIQKNDIVISTRYYDAGVFVADPVYKQKERQRTYKNERGVKQTDYWTEDGEELPNPYTELVEDNDRESRCKSLSVKSRGGEGSREERRIKVKKLCLMAWDDEKNEYPRQSGHIIFREKTLSFGDKYTNTLEYFREVMENQERYEPILSGERMREMRRMIPILEHLVTIPPFPCFFDEKYGFLIKREIRMTKVVYAPAEFGLGSKTGADWTAEEKLLGDPVKKVKEEIEKTEKDFADHIERRPIEFGEELLMVAMNPDRIDGIVGKYGKDAVEKTFGAE